MIFTPIRTHEIETAWPWLSETIEPAVRQVANVTMQSVYDDLVSGRDLAVEISGANARGVVILQITDDCVCWVKYLAGRAIGKNKMQTMRDGIAWIERAALNAGCHEVRVCGRNWGRLLTNYLLISDADEPNLLRKVLTMNEAA